MDLDTLLALAERCEKADGPDREIDVAIVFALYPDIGSYTPHCSGEQPIFWHDPYRKMPCPEFTGSIDAAMTLVPAELDVQMMLGNGESAEVIVVHRLTAMSDPRTAATLPLALCAAALRARTQESTPC